ncbi:MAG: FAD-binding oxidoreductase [Candidatus Binatus sp.]|uniref:FAD-binding oxidoreductase n=1 Tax=Candidatus Binatus sp. TaxID=2811406 RepID=UPI00271689B4|nr:FAD-binding oxidoreductase [Candidatus Binatus sp.]MDO8432517.1 FAD-binding oxidoreductase [Candidatus Binatus sp.]
MSADNHFEEIAHRVESQFGADRVRVPTALEANAARVLFEPASVEEICEAVRMCESDRITLAAVGAMRTLSQIRREPVALGISLKRLARIVAYEPDDMTVVAEAGLTISNFNAVAAPSRQRLPVDPASPQLTTLGSLISASHAGPLRLSEGAARDLLIGIRFVGHGGRVIHGGGRVVKNVAGYDLMKVMGGAFGTLGIITEATFKVRPIPPEYCIAIAPYDRANDAFSAAASLNFALPMSHLEVLSPSLAARFDAPQKFLLVAGFSGTAQEISYQAEKIRELLGAAIEIIDDQPALARCETLRDLDFGLRPLAAQIATRPAGLERALAYCDAEFRAHAASGVAQIFVETAPSSVVAHKIVARWRESAHSERGHLRILAAAESIRGDLEIFDLPNEGALKLMRQLKSTFDPAGIFNPKCFVGGI